MKKILLAVLLTAGSFLTCLAQSNPGKFSIGLEGGLPVGDYSDLYKFGIGGSLKYDLPVAPNFYVTFSAGYSSFQIKDEAKQLLRFFGSNQSSSGFVPLKVGGKYYFNNKGFFGEAQVGAAIATASGGGTAFAYSPGIGYTFDGSFEAGVRYEAWSKSGSTFGQFGLRLAYCFR